MTIFLVLLLYVATLIAFVVAVFFWGVRVPNEKIRRAPAPRPDGVTAAQRGGAREVFTEPQSGRRILAGGAVLLAVVLAAVYLVVVPELRWLALAWVAAFLLAAAFLLWTGRTNRLTVAPDGIRLRRYDGEAWLPAETIDRIDLLQAVQPARDGGSGIATRHYLLIAVSDPATIGRLSRRQRRLRKHLGQYGRATRPALVVIPDEYPGGVDAVCAALRRRLPRVPVRYADAP